MRKQKHPAEFGFDRYDKGRLERALQEASDKRTFVRIQAILLLAQGMSIDSVIAIILKSRRVIYYWLSTYLKTHQPAYLYDAPRKGRPLAAAAITGKRILKELKRNPLELGYNTNVWTVATLSRHLSQRYGCDIHPFTLYRRMKAMGLRSKRPRYVYSEKDPNRAQKKGVIVRKLRQMPSGAILLFEDETVLRLFPVLRRAWSLQGQQGRIAITGRNAQRVLFGTIDIDSGHRIVMQQPNMRQAGFQAFLYLLRRRYRKKPVWLLLDKGGLHTAPKSQALAEELNILTNVLGSC